MLKSKRTKKYFSPQTESQTYKCDCEGCSKKGEYKAPKDRNLKEYYWFCLKHVQEYNAKWNYYEGISSNHPEEEEVKTKQSFRFKSKVKYKFGRNMRDDFGFFDEYASDYSSMNDIFLNRQEKHYLKVMELDSKDLNIDALKKQYKKLAKKHHPDTNCGNKDSEEKFKEITIAYHALLGKLS